MNQPISEIDRRRSMDHDLLIEIKVKLDSFLTEMRAKDGELQNKITILEKQKLDRELYDEHVKEKNRLVDETDKKIAHIVDQMSLIEASRNKLIGALIVIQIISSIAVSLIIKKLGG